METIVLALIMFLLLYLIKEKIAVKKTTKEVVDRLCKKYYILEKATLKEQMFEKGYNVEEIRNIEQLINDLTVK